MDQRHGVQQLEGRRGPHDPVIVETAGRAIPPEAERRPQPFATGAGSAVRSRRARRSRAVRSPAPSIVPRPGTSAGPRRSALAEHATRRRSRRLPRWTCAQYLAPTPPASPTMMAREPLMTRSQKLALATAGTTIVLFSVGGLVRGIGLGARLFHVARVPSRPALPLRHRAFHHRVLASRPGLPRDRAHPRHRPGAVAATDHLHVREVGGRARVPAWCWPRRCSAGSWSRPS